MLRNAYRPWYFLKKIQEIEAIGAERDLAGLPKMEVPADIMSTGASAAQRAIRSHYESVIPKIRMGEYSGLVVPSETTPSGASSGYKFSLVQSGGRRPMDVDAIIRRYESRILISMMSEFLTLGSDNVGSHSLSSDKTSLHAMAVKSILDSIVHPINAKLIPDLCRTNDLRTTPRLTYGDLETEDLAAWAGSISGLISSGVVVPDDEVEGHVREKMGLPEKAATLDPSAPVAIETGPSDTGGAVAADTALNGAQVQAAKDIVLDVAAGRLPRDAGKNMLVEFFHLSPDRADRVLGTVGIGFAPTQESSPPAP